MSGNKNLCAVINFYEKVDAPPKHGSFEVGWRAMGKFVSHLDYFIGAQLHKNVDPEGRIKFTNLSTFDNTDDKVLKDMTNPAPELLAALMEHHGPPGMQISYPGAYTETKTKSGNPVCPDLPAKTESCFLISAFKAKDDMDSLKLEDNIDELVAMKVISEFAAESDGIEIGEWAFYRRCPGFTPMGPFKSYDFVFRCELRGVGENLDQARDLAKKVHAAPTYDGVERVDTSAYVIDKDNVIGNGQS